MTWVVAFTGRAGAGKTTAAEALVRRGFVKVPFAAPLKFMLSAFLQHQGADQRLVDRMIEGDLKQEPSDLLGGVSPRYAMQTLGTEWGRHLLAGDLWIRAWRNSVEATGATKIVVDDVRFPNEVAAIRAMSGVVIKIEGRAYDIETAHSSEDVPGDFDIVIHNGGTVGDLHGQIHRIVEL
jgi:hypothetical protein